MSNAFYLSSTGTQSAASLSAMQAFEKRCGVGGLENLTNVDFSGLLSSQMQDDLETVEQTNRIITGPEDLARTYFGYDAISAEISPGIADGTSIPYSLTADDYAFLKQATGYNYVTVQGYCSMWLDDNGNYANISQEQAIQFGALADSIDTARRFGELSGGITQGFIKQVIANMKQCSCGISAELEDRLLSLLPDTNSVFPPQTV